MHITVFGTGYVGLVQGSVLAEVGHDVLCVDVDAAKVEALKAGRIPIFEPGLEELVKKNHAAGRLRFTTDAATAWRTAASSSSPSARRPTRTARPTCSYVMAVADHHRRADGRAQGRRRQVDGAGRHRRPGAGADRRGARRAAAATLGFDVVSNPEFLKEGAAVADCMRPDRIVIGTSDPEAEDLLREVYAPFNRNHDKIIVMDVRSAELTKYAANCMLATKISFMNEIAGLAERLGADVEMVRSGHRLGPAHRLPLHLSRRRLRRLLLPQGREGADPHRPRRRLRAQGARRRSRTATTRRRR